MQISDDQKRTLVDFWVLLAIIGFLFTYFQPQYIFSKTITTGGDTASHYYTAQYLMEHLLPQGRVSGWDPGNFAGEPILIFYFPLPFVIMALLGYIIPLEIAFKIGTVLGIFLLPVCTYFSLRLMRFRFPVPILGALFTLPFLFIEANSMWGGNIPSTLAGEFCYSIGFAISVLFFGMLYDGITSGRHIIKNGVLVALIGFSHGYTLLYAGFASLFFLFTTEGFWKRLRYLLKIHTLGFCLMGFWLVPLIENLPNATGFNYLWEINSFFEVFPPIIIPFLVLAATGRVADIALMLWNSRSLSLSSNHGWQHIRQAFDARTYYLLFLAFLAIVLYRFAYKVHLVDARFLPLLEFFICMIAAIEVGRFVHAIERFNWFGLLRVQWVLPLLMAAATFGWVKHYESYIHSWIPWNYEGYEAKPNWNDFSEMSEYLKGSFSDPRVAFENSTLYNNEVGSPRAIETSPLFSNRSTLEGLYLQSASTAPFSYYIQAEISTEQSCACPEYKCTSLDLANGVRHLRMFNVNQLVVRSDNVKNLIKDHPDYVLEKEFGPYAVYGVRGNENSYVAPLKYEPVLYETRNWKALSYRWFRNMDALDVPLVMVKKAEQKDIQRFKTIMKGDFLYDTLPRIPSNAACSATAEIREEEIDIKTDCINKPLLVRVSYHPKWKVDGADGIYLVSPSLMLIYPQQEKVRMRFSATWPDYVGSVLTIIAVVICAGNIPALRRSSSGSRMVNAARAVNSAMYHFLRRPPAVDSILRFGERYRFRILALALLWVSIFFILIIFFYHAEQPQNLAQKGLNYSNEGKYSEAQEIFQRVISNHPLMPAGELSYFYRAITLYKMNEFDQAIAELQQFVMNDPLSVFAAEAYYHIGLASSNLGKRDQAISAYKAAIEKYPETMWADYSKERVNEFIPGSYVITPRAEASDNSASPADASGLKLDVMNQKAMEFFQAGSFAAAKVLFMSIEKNFPQSAEAENAMYLCAMVFYQEKNYSEAAGRFHAFVEKYPGSSYAPGAYFHIGISYQMLGNHGEAKKALKTLLTKYPDSGFKDMAKQMLNKMGETL